MRNYHIYKQKAKFVNCHSDCSIWKWLPFEYVCTVCGTKELNDLFHNRNFCHIWSLSFHDSFTYNRECFRRRESCWDALDSKPIERFLIVDDSGNIRNYHELTDKYKKKRNRLYWHRAAYQCHCFRNIGEQRRSITPDEIREIKDNYGITMLPIKPKRNIEPWDNERCHTYSKGWKAQTKRRKQYKPKEIV